jgi:2-phosphosulfolactate phosphatase
VAVDRDVTVFPYRWHDDRAEAFAAAHHATLAVGRSVALPGQVSLSPHSVRAAPFLERLVLPSPNGSTISFELAAAVPDVIGVSLRNRQAAAKWLLQRRQRQPTLRIAVIAPGERWPDGSLRPAIEDQWGAGGLIDLPCEAEWQGVAPEAHAAAAAYRAIAHDILIALGQCASGRELIEIGFADDVRTRVAALVD